MVARPEVPGPAPREPARAVLEGPWNPNARGALRRLAVVRLFALLPLAGLALLAAWAGRLAAPTMVFTLLGAAAVSALLLETASRRAGDGAAARLLQFSLAADAALILGLTAVAGPHAPVVAGLVVLPLFAAALLAGERAAAALTAATLAMLPVVLATVRAQPLPPLFAATLVGLPAGGIVFAVLAQRRKARFLEERVRHLEDERFRLGVAEEERRIAVEQAERARQAVLETATNGAGGPAAADVGLGAVAHALARELTEPLGVVRARAENLRLELAGGGAGEAPGKALLPEVDRLLAAADRLEDARLTLTVLCGELGTAASPADLRGVLRELKDSFAAGLALDGVVLRVESSRGLPRVALSHNEARLLVVRFLEAARRGAAGRGRPIRLLARASRSGDGVALVLEDRLPSSAASRKPTGRGLFGEGVGDPPPDGPGEARAELDLALAVARLLAERRRGRLEVERARRGTLRVRVFLPAAAAPVAPEDSRARPRGRGRRR